MIHDPIKRTLAYEDHRQERRIIDEGAIPEFQQPVIILGDPGLGKSVLADTLGALPKMRKVRAGKLMRTSRPETLIDAGERIIVDGLDEIASASPGGGVHTVSFQALGNGLSALHSFVPRSRLARGSRSHPDLG